MIGLFRADIELCLPGGQGKITTYLPTARHASCQGKGIRLALKEMLVGVKQVWYKAVLYKNTDCLE